MMPNAPSGRSPATPALVAAASVALLAGAMLLGRGAGTEPGGADPEQATPAAETVVPPAAAAPGDGVPASTPNIPSELRSAPAVRAAVAMAARDAGVAEDEVVITDVREITWPSSALGCPQPDMMYLEVLTPGYRVMTFAAGARRIYHTNRGGVDDAVVVPCSAEVSKQGGVDLPPAQLEALRADAARRAGASDAVVELVGLRPSRAVTLTCDEVAAAGDAEGALSMTSQMVWDATLRAGAQEHRYRVSASGYVHCGGSGVDEDGNPID